LGPISKIWPMQPGSMRTTTTAQRHQLHYHRFSVGPNRVLVGRRQESSVTSLGLSVSTCRHVGGGAERHSLFVLCKDFFLFEYAGSFVTLY
jgi:hypothetical protein